MNPEDFLNFTNQNTPSIDELAARVPSYSDDFTLPPLTPTVEDALVLPRQNYPDSQEITPPDALQFMNLPSSN